MRSTFQWKQFTLFIKFRSTANWFLKKSSTGDSFTLFPLIDTMACYRLFKGMVPNKPIKIN